MRRVILKKQILAFQRAFPISIFLYFLLHSVGYTEPASNLSCEERWVTAVTPRDGPDSWHSEDIVPDRNYIIEEVEGKLYLRDLTLPDGDMYLMSCNKFMLGDIECGFFYFDVETGVFRKISDRHQYIEFSSGICTSI